LGDREGSLKFREEPSMHRHSPGTPDTPVIRDRACPLTFTDSIVPALVCTIEWYECGGTISMTSVPEVSALFSRYVESA
jgi:hypothetical protein